MINKNQRENKMGISGVGISSIVVIFVIMCLVTFAVLSLVSAQADKNLSQKSIQHMQQYFAAEEKAYQKLAQIDNALYENQNIQEIKDIKVFKDSQNNTRVEYTVVISEEQKLIVELRLENNMAQLYTITKWQTQNTAQWQADQSLPVLKKTD